MIVGKTVRLIGGLPGECVEFTDDGKYYVDLCSSRPGESRYSVSALEHNGLGELDVWIKGLEPLTARCIYHIDDDVLKICIAGNSGERPTQLLRDDDRLWCLKTLKRTVLPDRQKPSQEMPLLKPGSFIPDAFLDP